MYSNSIFNTFESFAWQWESIFQLFRIHFFFLFISRLNFTFSLCFSFGVCVCVFLYVCECMYMCLHVGRACFICFFGFFCFHLLAVFVFVDVVAISCVLYLCVCMHVCAYFWCRHPKWPLKRSSMTFHRSNEYLYMYLFWNSKMLSVNFIPCVFFFIPCFLFNLFLLFCVLWIMLISIA